MKYISYGMLCMVIFQVTYPSQHNAQSVAQNSNDDAQTRENSVSVLDLSDKMSPGGALRRNSAVLNHQPHDTAALKRHSTFYLLDREISDLSRKMSLNKCLPDTNEQGLSSEFQILCEKVRSFQLEQANDEIDSVLLEPLESTLVGALFVVACQQGLSLDIIPTPISSLSRCNASVNKATVAAAASAQSNQMHHSDSFVKGLISVGSGIKAFVPPIDLISLEPKSNKFPDIPMATIVGKCDSDLESCDGSDDLQDFL
ncbi:MAG: hypothetical protein WC747_01210 [Candidatus Babeliales bacterium]|jgi:hypothetical protein